MTGEDALKSWADGWIKEGYFISYLKDSVWYYEYVVARDFAHWEYEWFETIASGVESGPQVPDLLEITKGFDAASNTNQIWQLIFGMHGQVLLYIELPTDTHRHGIPKQPKPSSINRRTSHYEEWMSPYFEPSFITEHFLMREEVDRINLSAYNYHTQPEPDFRLNFFINKMKTERIGTASNGVTEVSRDRKGQPITRWEETLDKLYRRQIPCRPISLFPVTAPAEAHH